MRALLALLVMSSVAAAEPLPAYSIGASAGGFSGTGADAKNLGFGYALGGHATFQPMTTESRIGLSLKLTALFSTMYYADAARVSDQLLLLDMDLQGGVRVRPGTNPSRYIAFRAGAGLLRADQVIPPKMHRAYAGGIASIGFEQYIAGWVINLDVRYGLIGTGPSELGLVLGFAKTGP